MRPPSMGPTQTDNRLPFTVVPDTGATTDVAWSHAKEVPKLFGRSSRDRRVLGRWAVGTSLPGHCLA